MSLTRSHSYMPCSLLTSRRPRLVICWKHETALAHLGDEAQTRECSGTLFCTIISRVYKHVPRIRLSFVDFLLFFILFLVLDGGLENYRFTSILWESKSLGDFVLCNFFITNCKILSNLSSTPWLSFEVSSVQSFSIHFAMRTYYLKKKGTG